MEKKKNRHFVAECSARSYQVLGFLFVCLFSSGKQIRDPLTDAWAKKSKQKIPGRRSWLQIMKSRANPIMGKEIRSLDGWL